MIAIDLNGDAGENPAAIADGSEEAFVASLTSANVACGGHAGNVASMAAMVAICRSRGVALGAHPSYPDRANFGRVSMPLEPDEVEAAVFEQVHALALEAKGQGTHLVHLKPHGALYHDCARRPEIAEAVARAARRQGGDLALVAAVHSPALATWQGMGFRVLAEAFADRRYEPDGTLRSRAHDDALIVDPVEAAAQAVRIATRGEVLTLDGTTLQVRAQSICVHGDTPGAAAIAAAVRRRLVAAGVRLG
ncbi:MAG TPA: 5-oxoprolinase subunit PxpA [Candidatus Polarisedimenticolaceae bacterium]